MPTAIFTSATQSTRSSRTSSSSRDSMDGFDSPYIPGWDCHGLPIELQVEKKHGRPGQKLDVNAFRAACRAFAQAQIEQQRKDFKRLGVLRRLGAIPTHHGPATTRRSRSAPSARSSRRDTLQGREAGALVLRLPLGACRSGSGVRREDLAVHRRRHIAWWTTGAREARRSYRSGTLGDAAVDVVIWTTTPWSLPGSQAVSLRDEFRYALVRSARGHAGSNSSSPSDLLSASLQRFRRRIARDARRSSKGRALEGLKLAASVPGSRGARDPRRARDAGCRHGRRAHGAGAWPGGLRGREAIRARGRQPGRQRRALPCPIRRWSAGSSSKRAARRSSRSSRSAGGCCITSPFATAIRIAGATSRR